MRNQRGGRVARGKPRLQMIIGAAAMVIAAAQYTRRTAPLMLNLFPLSAA